jgi:hypothetical protein
MITPRAVWTRTRRCFDDSGTDCLTQLDRHFHRTLLRSQ